MRYKQTNKSRTSDLLSTRCAEVDYIILQVKRDSQKIKLYKAQIKPRTRLSTMVVGS
jgi:hypothetical protein